MRLSDFDFPLPDELVARFPAPRRDGSRLLHLTGDGAVHHRRFPDLVEVLRPEDVLVTNDTAVLPARLVAHKEGSGGRVEVLLVEPLDEGEGPEGTGAVHPGAGEERWRVLLGASKRPRVGQRLAVGRTRLEVRRDEGDGFFEISVPGGAKRLTAAHGELPLPPYLGRTAEAVDDERYQTVYADPDKRLSVAAPTAGLHFTPELLETLVERGVEHRQLTLHVGPGTFLPVRGEDVNAHRMHAERFEVPEATAEAVERAHAEGRRVIAVGTTTTRVLESFGGPVRAGPGETDLFIRPGSRFHRVGAMVTNFHLPRSTLVMLVCAFAGTERTLAAYREAVQQRYRFFSYGDAMFVEAPAGGEGR